MNNNEKKIHSNSCTKSVDRALLILSTFTESSPQQKVITIANKLSMNPSTVSRHLTTLCNANLIERDNNTGFYHLGNSIITMAGNALMHNPAYRYSQNVLYNLSVRNGLNYQMTIPCGLEMVHLTGFCGLDSKDLPMPIGHRHPVYLTAMGRMYLSTLPDQQIKQILNKCNIIEYNSYTKTDIDQIYDEILLARKNGFCVVDNEITYGKCSVATPIFNINRECVAAISVTTHVENDKYSISELSKMMMVAANDISSSMGYHSR